MDLQQQVIMLEIIFGGLGLLAGSFINAWVWRVKQGKKISRGRSMCPHCQHQLSASDLVPVFSFIFLRGRCRYCKKPISWQYPIVELVTAFTFICLAAYFLPLANLQLFSLIIWLAVAVLVIAAAVYDYKWMILPDRFMIPAICLGIIYVTGLFLQTGQTMILWRFGAALVLAGFFFSLWYLSGGKWMGDGDIRVAFLMGLMLSPSQLVVGVFLAFNIAAVVSLVLIGARLRTRKDLIPFGPFLILGMFLGLFWGERLVNWYMTLLG